MKAIALIAAALTLASAAAAAAAPSRNDARAHAYAEALQTARGLESDGRLREAVWWLRVAQVVAASPRAMDPQIGALETRIATVARTRVADGDRLRRRAPQKAAAAYREALSLDPGCEPARQALREMETAAMLATIARGGGGGPAAARPER